MLSRFLIFAECCDFWKKVLIIDKNIYPCIKAWWILGYCQISVLFVWNICYTFTAKLRTFFCRFQLVWKRCCHVKSQPISGNCAKMWAKSFLNEGKVCAIPDFNTRPRSFFTKKSISFYHSGPPTHLWRSGEESVMCVPGFECFFCYYRC